MFLHLTLPIFYLTCMAFARVLPRPSLELLNALNSRTNRRDLDPLAQNVPQSCSVLSYINERGVLPRDNLGYGSSTAGNQQAGSKDTFGILDNPMALDLSAHSPTQNDFSVIFNQPLNGGIENNTPNSQDKDINEAISTTTLLIDSGLSASDNQLLNIGSQNNPFEKPVANYLLNNIQAKSPSASPSSVAFGNVDVSNPSDNPDVIENNELLAAISPAIPYDPETGAPTALQECISPGSSVAYTVWEMVYQGTKPPVWRWPHAILLAEGLESLPPFRRYTVVRSGSATHGLQFGKNDPFLFIQKGQPVLLNSITRRGWLIAPDGIKAEPFNWFEAMARNSQMPTPQSYASPNPAKHFTAEWARLFLRDLNNAGSTYWIPFPSES